MLENKLTWKMAIPFENAEECLRLNEFNLQRTTPNSKERVYAVGKAFLRTSSMMLYNSAIMGIGMYVVDKLN